MDGVQDGRLVRRRERLAGGEQLRVGDERRVDTLDGGRHLLEKLLDGIGALGDHRVARVRNDRFARVRARCSFGGERRLYLRYIRIAQIVDVLERLGDDLDEPPQQVVRADGHAHRGRIGQRRVVGARLQRVEQLRARPARSSQVVRHRRAERVGEMRAHQRHERVGRRGLLVVALVAVIVFGQRVAGGDAVAERHVLREQRLAGYALLRDARGRKPFNHLRIAHGERRRVRESRERGGVHIHDAFDVDALHRARCGRRAAEGARRDALHRVGGGILPRLHHHDGGGNRDDARSVLRQPGQHDRSLRGARVAHDRVRHVHARLLVHDGVPRRRERLQRAEREHERHRQDSHRDAARARHDRSSSHSLAPSSSSDESLANAGWGAETPPDQHSGTPRAAATA